MIDQWRKERWELDQQIRSVHVYIEEHPNKDKFQGSRIKLRILLNDLSVRRMKVHQKILKYEDEERLQELFKNIANVPEDTAKQLWEAMERLRLVDV